MAFQCLDSDTLSPQPSPRAARKAHHARHSLGCGFRPTFTRGIARTFDGRSLGETARFSFTGHPAVDELDAKFALQFPQ